MQPSTMTGRARNFACGLPRAAHHRPLAASARRSRSHSRACPIRTVKWRFRNHADADEEGLIIVEVSSRAERLALDLDPVQGLDGGVEQAIGHRVVAGAVWVRDAAEFGHRG